ncbi:hypothetical protein PFLG_02721 [Plasmodium falciparum RAJ116]|uniref:Uncharacterized protein n=1 Tax=Plasmodium falciparum RAJ116 TaxID=580058 RepID=A0A0L0CZP8_PLAFA|nr:hypothetical protein PFLG_02721 [Plasmodium falciparum RAJ116]
MGTMIYVDEYNNEIYTKMVMIIINFHTNNNNNIYIHNNNINNNYNNIYIHNNCDNDNVMEKISNIQYDNTYKLNEEIKEDEKNIYLSNHPYDNLKKDYHINEQKCLDNTNNQTDDNFYNVYLWNEIKKKDEPFQDNLTNENLSDELFFLKNKNYSVEKYREDVINNKGKHETHFTSNNYNTKNKDNHFINNSYKNTKDSIHLYNLNQVKKEKLYTIHDTKNLVLRKINILKEFDHKFLSPGMVNINIHDEDIKKNKHYNFVYEEIIHKYCLSIFKKINISTFFKDNEKRIFLMENYWEYSILTLHDFNVNMVHDMPARLNLRKIIYKYLILELFTNAQSCNFLTCIEKGTTFLISHINKDMEKEIFQKKSRKYINLMKKCTTFSTFIY